MEKSTCSPVSDEMKSTWYKALHDLIPTNDRLGAINLTDTSVCATCGHPDSLQHKITECEEGPVIWTWKKKLLAYILCVDHRQITKTWTIHPEFPHRPPPRDRLRSSGLWRTSFIYRLPTQRRLSLLDYVEFMHRASWKLYQQAPRPQLTGRYLDVIDWPQY